jgi:hypothetical protein
LQPNFHEIYADGEVKPPSERSTGLLFAAVATIIAVLWRSSPIVLWVALSTSIVLVFISVITPAQLRPLNVMWFRFGLLLHRIVNPIVMFTIFATVFVPAGAIMRLYRDPLRSKRPQRSYWIERNGAGHGEASMKNQF